MANASETSDPGRERSVEVVSEPTTRVIPSQNADSPSIPPSSLPGTDIPVVEIDRLGIEKAGGAIEATQASVPQKAIDGSVAAQVQRETEGLVLNATVDPTSIGQSDQRLQAYFSSFLDALVLTAKTGLNIFFIFGSIVQYYGQFWDIRRGKGEAFSPLVCLVLLSANIIRIFYWFGERFDDLYLYQSAVMVFVQIMMLEAICKAKEKRPASPNVPKKRFTDFRLADFWAWDEWTSYLMCIGAFTSALCVACVLALPYPGFFSWLGGLGLMIEATLALPQLYRNYKHGSDGLDAFLIWTWVVGDIAKTALAVALQTPAAFVISGLFQVVTDVLILVQIYTDRKRKDKSRLVKEVELSTSDAH